MSKTQHDSEVPAQGQQVITVCAFIHRKNDAGEHELFMPRRASTKKFLPGAYELPGGHVDFGEELVSALKREVMEEFGVQISVGDPFAAFTYTNEIKGSHSLELVYFAKFQDPEEKIKLDPEDHSEYIWLNETGHEEELVKLGKGKDDNEHQLILKGFKLLKGEGLSLS